MTWRQLSLAEMGMDGGGDCVVGGDAGGNAGDGTPKQVGDGDGKAN